MQIDKIMFWEHDGVFKCMVVSKNGDSYHSKDVSPKLALKDIRDGLKEHDNTLFNDLDKFLDYF